METEKSISNRKRIGTLLRGVIKILEGNPEGLKAKTVLASLRSVVPPNELDQGEYKDGSSKYDKIVRFATIDIKHAGWLSKHQGVWSVTKEGLQAYYHYTDPAEFYREAARLYRARIEIAKPTLDENPELEADDIGNVKSETAFTLEIAEEQAYEQLESHLLRMPPLIFQNLVGALLKAMSYFVTESLPGADGGIDIIAFRDALGVQPPRIKVQVKRLADRINEKDLRPFLSLIGDGDVGIFVNTGGFGNSALKAVRSEHRKITLIDAQQFLELWIKYYHQLEDSARERLPMRAVWFLRNPEE